MQAHTSDETVRRIDVGEYHAGAVVLYVGPFRIVTYTAEDCDMLIAAACLAKQRHEGVLRPGAVLPDLGHVLPALRAKLADVALGEDQP